MRLWLPEDERRPDPDPVPTDDRAAVVAGLAVWVVALGALLLFVGALVENDLVWLLWTCLVGIGLGLVALVYTHGLRRGR